MSKALQTKIREVEEEYAEEYLQKKLGSFAQNERDRAAVAIGVIGAFEKIANVLSAESIRALIQFQESKMHESLGFDRFENFLNESPYAPMTKNQFYDRKKLLETEGDSLYDLLNNVGIPVSKRKLLASGQTSISIEGNEIIVGEERADLSDLPTIKSLIRELATDNQKMSDEQKSKDKKIEDLQSRVKTGQSEYEEIRRAMDAANSGTPYERALMKTISAMLNLTLEAGKLTLVETQTRGKADIELLWNQMLNVRAALQQEDYAFIENANTDLPESVKKVLSEDDDWGDEEEV